MPRPALEDSGRIRRRNLLGLGLILLLQTALLWPFRGYFTDDTFIHLQFARQLMTGGGFAFNPGEPTYGFTSPAWVALIALLGTLGLDLLAAAKILGLLFTLAAVPGIWLLLGEFVDDPRFRWAATVSFALDAWLLRWALSGMETSLAVCLVTWSLFLYFRARRRGLSFWGPGLALALAVLCRPECLGLVALVLIDAVFCGVLRRRDWLCLTLPLVVIVGGWMGFCRLEFGQVLPNTVYAKSGSFVLLPQVVIELLWRELKVLAATRVWETLLAALGVVAVILGAARGGGPSFIRVHLRRYGLLLAWSVGVPTLFLLRDTVLLSRYFLLVVPAALTLGWAALAELTRTRDRGSPRFRLLPVLLALILAQNLYVLYGVAYPHTVEFTAGLRRSLFEIAEWLRTESEPTATVAIPDIGIVGYESGRKVIDLSGLVTPELIDRERQRTAKIEDYIASFGFRDHFRPDYLVDRSVFVERLHEPPPPGVRLETVLIRRIGALGLARANDFYYTLYRVTWIEGEESGP